MKGDIGFPDAPDPRDLERAARWPSEEAQAVYERSRFAQRAQAVAGRGQNPDTQPYVGDDDHAEPWIDRGGRDTRSPALEAHDIVHGARREKYGHPADNLAHTADLWRAQFGWDVSAGDVALAQVLLKMSRLRRSPEHRDNVVDIVGYAEAYWLTVEDDR